MKFRLLLLLAGITIIGYSASSLLNSGLIDLNSLENYANQVVPNYITDDNTPLNNSITDQGATLGRVLFYDKKLSINNTIACASCHQQAFAFSDPAAVSTGVNGVTGRHSMRLVNSRFADEDNFFWDERANSLEEQTTMPIQDHAEMGFSGTNGDPALDSLLRKLEAITYYQQLFTFVYGDANITEERMQLAMAQFIRSIQSFDSKYDTGRALVNNPNAPFPNFSPQENTGKQLFMQPPAFDVNGNRIAGGAGCNGCHNAPEFDIVPNSGNNGVIGVIAGGTDLTNTRSPSLRDMVDHNGIPFGPFMHDASLSTLLDVINHYDQITGNPGLDPRLRPGGNPQNLQLTTVEKNQLIAFLETLTGNVVYLDEKLSDPFDSTGNLTVIDLIDLNSKDLFASSLNITSATLNWTKAECATSYIIEGGLEGSNSTTWLSFTAPASSDSIQTFNVNNLAEGTAYIWRIYSVCNTTVVSKWDTFSTLTCDAPINLTTTILPNNAVQLNWTEEDAAIGYVIRGGVIGSSETELIISGSSTNSYITDVLPPANYHWRIRSGCSLNPLTLSDNSPTENFTISNPLSKQIHFDFTIYPNPVSDVLHVKLPSTQSDISIYDVQGNLVFTASQHPGKAIKINVSELPISMYVLKVRTGDDDVYSEKFLVRH